MTAGFLAGIMVVAGGVYATSSNYIVHAEEVQEEVVIEIEGTSGSIDVVPFSVCLQNDPANPRPCECPGGGADPVLPRCADCGVLIDPFRPCACRPGLLGIVKIEVE